MLYNNGKNIYTIGPLMKHTFYHIANVVIVQGMLTGR